MKQAAQAAEAVNLRNQIEAARNRLLKELGRTLRCIGSGDLNAVLRKQIERESKSNERYRDLLTVALCTLFCTPTEFFERILEYVGNPRETILPMKEHSRANERK